MAYFLGRRKGRIFKEEGRLSFLSQIDQFGWYALTWMILPALGVFVLAFLLHILGIISVPAVILLFGALTVALAGLAQALHSISPGLRARQKLEKVIYFFLFLAAVISILTTLGIVLSVIFEAIKFFQVVSVWEFISGTQWSPDTAFLQGAERAGEEAAKPQFGAVPIFAGTFMITFIAMCVAIPVGLLSAIYMSEYAGDKVRAVAKPLLEILAGIPTVVYGFFAAITVSPLVVRLAESVGLEADYTNALAPGLVMGIMIIPFISSLSDDVIRAIPQSLREGSYALGLTTSETIKQVLLPAALPGIVSAFLLAVSRALGETMIVVMAAGLRPNLTMNPLEGMTTVTVRIVDALTGDLAFDSLETLSAFALGLTLLLITLILNLISTIVIRKFKQKYE
ncbi:MAG: phosphate ABC transporter permease subunit PstC [Desulfohalobiaceae bacterium]|nr:phosphate ABC transporter permease subunit PstC [Desulfohalobiaceae bacterium]